MENLILNLKYMPYKIKGNTVYRKDTGEKVGTSKDPEKYIRTLQAIEHNPKFAKKLVNKK